VSEEQNLTGQAEGPEEKIIFCFSEKPDFVFGVLCLVFGVYF
jgi:hypothetical protein